MLSRFFVRGLHGDLDLLVTIENDRLIVVGENGAGKSTLVNLIYHFITAQWHRLLEVRFSSISAVIGEREIEVTHEALEQWQEDRVHRIRRGIPPSLLRSLRMHDASSQQELFSGDETAITRLVAESGYPPSYVRRALAEVRSDRAEQSPLELAAKYIKDTLPGQVVYLPTYRRIEHDLQSIFRGIEVEAQLKKLRESVGQGRRKGGFVELVEFGMQDVQQTVDARIASLKESLRAGLSNLTGTYLRDVIRGVHTQADIQSVLALEMNDLDAILARLDEETLPEVDKQNLLSKVVGFREKGQVSQEDTVVIHFLTKLLELFQAQQREESVLAKFVETCNRYLVGKRLFYDHLTYRLTIEGAARGRASEAKSGFEEGRQVPFKALSSGEKQIVSLFSHLYLSGRDGFYVLIDEPELSLSVPWQRQFLPDILRTGLCSGLIAVTHSPFIWENDLEKCVHSMSDFAEAARVVH